MRTCELSFIVQSALLGWFRGLLFTNALTQ